MKKTGSELLGVSLSGGGARCIAHIGVLKAMEEQNIRPDVLCGCSGGAIVGALYASGHAPDAILKLVISAKLFPKLTPSFNLKGLLSTRYIVKILKPYIAAQTFEELQVPLTVNAVNLSKGENRFFSQGPLLERVAASCAIPFIFSPYSEAGDYYIDGGILQNMPIQPLEEAGCSTKIGVHVNPYPRLKPPKNMKETVERASLLAISQQLGEVKGSFDFFCEPKGLDAFAGTAIKEAETLFNLGYAAGLELAEAIGGEKNSV